MRRLEHIGAPLELFIGFLAPIAILIPVYANFFLAALDLGLLGRMSGLIGIGAPFALGRYAIFRAQCYRLTRAIFPSLRSRQEGSA